MMNSFNVLDRKLNVHNHHLLEASAGTGKTFSIENIVARLLIENTSPIALEKILIMTFTRAAARDLKTRIRSTLEKLLSFLKNNSSNSVPDYLLALIEKGPDSVLLTKQRLEQALASFDQAQIFTIHSFCLRMLKSFVFESHFSLQTNGHEEKNFKKEEVFQLITDFFHTEIRFHRYSPTQLQILLDWHDNDIEKLKEALYISLSKNYEMIPAPSFSEELEVFNKLMEKLKINEGFQTEKLIADFDKQRECYKILKKVKIDSIYHFFELFKKSTWQVEDFDFLIQEGLGICDLLSPQNVYKKKQVPDISTLHYPKLLSTLQKDLLPFINKSRSYAHIFARMLYDCRDLMQKYAAEEEKYREDDLLKKMCLALENPHFASKIREHYKAAIVDEFQDTDPIQWHIFQKIFMDTNSRCILYLVGDPKQSIYSFRQADIYTYLSASDALEKKYHASLDTNYRSQPCLVKGLNALFKACPQLFALPEKNRFLDYPIVKHSCFAQEKQFSDGLGSIHFFGASLQTRSNQKFPSEQSEEKFYFPFMVQEILRLNQKDQLKFRQFAILVKDRFQAQRLADFLARFKIPYNLQRQAYLTESPAWESLKELLKGILHPKNENHLKIALGGTLIGWTYKDILALDDPLKHEAILNKFYHYQNKLIEKGFAHFFHDFIHQKVFSEELSISESLLQQEGGDIFYDELTQIANLLIEHEGEQSAGPQRLIKFMDDCKNSPPEDEERLKKFSDPARDAVTILTIHNSKGLEFDVVFAYGLIGRHKSNEHLIPAKIGDTRYLIPCEDQNSEEYLAYSRELDAEKMRQLYVAMTRAKFRLYLPMALGNQNKLEFGSASPMDLFLAHLNQCPCTYQELYQRIEVQEGKSLHEFINNNPDLRLTSTDLDLAQFSIPAIKTENRPSLIFRSSPNISIPASFIQSFTSLSKNKKRVNEDTHLQTPQEFQVCEKTPHTLPAGTSIGKLLHKIMEVLPFDEIQHLASSSDMKPWILPYVEGTFFSEWMDVICDMTYRALRVQLENKFCLGDIASDCMYRETEFLYPYEKEMVLDEMQWQSGFLKGVIDLIFFHREKYYLVDWKTNWLGNSCADYSQEKMAAAMHAHSYYFQAHIYKEALKRYLKVVDPRPFESIYGGGFYIFMRGLVDSSDTYGILKL